MTWWIWIIFGLLLLAAEVVVPGGIIMLFFGAAALIVGLLVALGLGGPIWLQWALFSVVSVVSLLALRGPILRRMRSSPEQPDSIDSLVGRTAVVAESIAPGALGKAELRGTSWTAKNVGKQSLEAGQTCVVEQVEGLQLNIRETQEW